MATSNRNFTTPGAPIQHHVMSQPVQRKIPRSTPPAQSPKEQQDDLTAFNKLLSLMQAGAAAAVESPNKMPQIVSLPCLLLKAIVNNITILYMYVLKYLFHDLKLHQGLLHFNYYLGGLECYFIIFFTVGGESLSTELCWMVIGSWNVRSSTDPLLFCFKFSGSPQSGTTDNVSRLFWTVPGLHEQCASPIPSHSRKCGPKRISAGKSSNVFVADLEYFKCM